MKEKLWNYAGYNHLSAGAFFTFQAVFLMILRFLVIDTDIFRKFAVAYSFSWCGDDARKRPKYDDITDSFAVGIWALVGLQGTALGSFYIV